MAHVYDCIVIGGGPAGLSAAIYVARFNRSVLVLDQKRGRSSYPQINENYLGFPSGVMARKLRRLGRIQAERFGVIFSFACVESITFLEGLFTIKGQSEETFDSHSLILATGVVDLFPGFEAYRECVGRSLFWCITCDGFKTINKRIIVVGATEDSATTALQFLQFTPHITFLTNQKLGATRISDKQKASFDDHGIKFMEGVIKDVASEAGMVHSLYLEDGSCLETDYVFSHQGALPHSKLAKELGVKVNEAGYIEVDSEQRTSHPHVYAAGDVTKLHSHQIATAVHEGSMAGQAANYDLYLPEQKMS